MKLIDWLWHTSIKKYSKFLSVVIALVGMMFTGIIIAVTINAASFVLEKHADEHVIEIMKKVSS